jgi:hypothetical protein
LDYGLTRVVDGVEERLCWHYRVHGRADAVYEPASNRLGPLDRDRQRRLKRGETFQRLDSSGSPREYQGLVWRPTSSLAASAR